MSEMEEARKRLCDALMSARKSAEYANGYNSSEWIGGRLEGMALAIEAFEGRLKPGQWSKP